LDYLEASTSAAVGPGPIKEAIEDEGMCLFATVALSAILVKADERMMFEGKGVINFYDRIGAEALKKRALFCSQDGTLDTVPVSTGVDEEGR
jgi:hypothetical protein